MPKTPTLDDLRKLVGPLCLYSYPPDDVLQFVMRHPRTPFEDLTPTERQDLMNYFGCKYCCELYLHATAEMLGKTVVYIDGQAPLELDDKWSPSVDGPPDLLCAVLRSEIKRYVQETAGKSLAEISPELRALFLEITACPYSTDVFIHELAASMGKTVVYVSADGELLSAPQE